MDPGGPGIHGPCYSSHNFQIDMDFCTTVVVHQSLILALSDLRALEEKAAAIFVHDKVDVLWFC